MVLLAAVLMCMVPGTWRSLADKGGVSVPGQVRRQTSETQNHGCGRRGQPGVPRCGALAAGQANDTSLLARACPRYMEHTRCTLGVPHKPQPWRICGAIIFAGELTTRSRC